MPFVKLDCGLLDSTLWIDRDGRELFITALLMARPVELANPLPQLAIRSLDETGWILPPGHYGFVGAAGSGIIRRAGVDEAAGLDALERLGQPEPDSRSRDFDGRRMIRVDGGFVILNYMKYRERDYTAAARQRRLRERQRNPVIIQLRERDGDVCGICAQPLGSFTPHIDHIIPLGQQGHPSDIRNLQLAHPKCNQGKSGGFSNFTLRNSALKPTYKSQHGLSRRHKREFARTSRKQKQKQKYIKTPLTPLDFDRFWQNYPNKVAKKKALDVYVKAIKNGATAAAILSGLERSRRSEQWQKDGGAFIPHPATWLNQERWKDEGITPPKSYHQPTIVPPTEEEKRPATESELAHARKLMADVGLKPKTVDSGATLR